MWSIINNGGGQAGIYGSLDIVANAPLQALQQNSKNMVGIGMAPEGIFQNYVVFDLLAEVRVWGGGQWQEGRQGQGSHGQEVGVVVRIHIRGSFGGGGGVQGRRDGSEVEDVTEAGQSSPHRPTPA